MTRDTRLLPGHQIWGLTPGFAATFWTGFSFQKIFRERLFSGSSDTHPLVGLLRLAVAGQRLQPVDVVAIHGCG